MEEQSFFPELYMTWVSRELGPVSFPALVRLLGAGS